MVRIAGDDRRDDRVGVAVDPAAHLRQLADRDVVPVGDDARQVLRDRILETHLAAIDQLQDAGDHEGLRDAADALIAVDIQRRLGLDAADPDALLVELPVAAPHADDDPGDLGLADVGRDRLRQPGAAERGPAISRPC